MRAEHRQPRKPPRDLFEVHGPHATRRDVLRLVEHLAQHDAGVEQHDPGILVGQLVDRVVRAIGERLPRKLQLTEAAVPQIVQLSHLLRHVRRIELHVSEREDLRGVLAGRFSHDLAVLRRASACMPSGCNLSETRRKSSRNVRNLLVEVQVHVHDPVRCGGVGRGRRWCSGGRRKLRAHHAQRNSGGRGGEKVRGVTEVFVMLGTVA